MAYMAGSETGKQFFGEELLNNGWVQGALFEAPSIYFAYHDLTRSTSGSMTNICHRNLKNKEKLILISQDCDIKASVGVEPYIEALICKPQNPKFTEKVSQLSSRWFVVDPTTCLVAEAKYKIQIAKEVLLHLKPEPWPDSPHRLLAFIRWLARRYDRPALPDEMVEVFQKPIESKMAELKTTSPTIFFAFNNAVHNIRVNSPPSKDGGLDLDSTATQHSA